MKSNEIYQVITNQIIEKLENHKLNWNKTWFDTLEHAHNVYSNNYYSFFNSMFLSMMMTENDFKTNRWITFKQASEMGAKVIKGQKAKPVFYINVVFFDKDKNKLSKDYINGLSKKQLNELIMNREIFKIPFLKEYKVFNVKQVEGLPDEYYKSVLDKNKNDNDTIDRIENLIANSGANIQHKENIETPVYNGLNDVIKIFPIAAFKSSIDYYKALLHEMGHWTKKENRCDRKKKTGEKGYAFEELVAELTAAFVCAKFDIMKEITNNAAYIQSWLAALNDDKTFVYKAAKLAEKAANYILSFNVSNNVAA